VIKTLAVTKVTPGMPGPPPTPASLSINLKGENFDPKANIKVDNDVLRANLFTITGKTDPQSQFCSDIIVSLLDADKYIQDTHCLVLVNSDAQSATMTFPIDPLAIDPVPDLTKGTAQVAVEITGQNFADGLSATWIDAAKKTTPALIDSRDGSTKLKIKLTPGDTAGDGTLTLTSAIGLKASKKVTVKEPPPPK